MHQTTMSRPPRPPQAQQQPAASMPQQGPSTLALLRSGSGQRSANALSTLPRGPAVPSLLTNHGSASGSSLQSLKDQADHMLQQQRADQKNREEMANQLKLKEAEIQRLTQLVTQQTQANNELTTQLQKSDERVQEIHQKMGFLDNIHNDLLMALHHSGDDLTAGRGEAGELAAKYAEQDAAIERLTASYKQLSTERADLQARYDEVLAASKEAQMQLKVASDNERLLNDLVTRGQGAEEHLLAQVHVLEEQRLQLEQQLANATRTATGLSTQLPLQVSAAKQEVETRMAVEVAQLQQELCQSQALLAAAQAQTARQTADLQEQAGTITTITQQLQEMTAAKQALSDKLDSAREVVQAELANTAGIKAKLEQATQDVDNLKATCQELQCKLDTEQEDHTTTKESLERMASEHAAAMQAAAEQHQLAEASFKDQEQRLTGQLASLRQELEEAQQAHAAAAQEMSTHKDQLQGQLGAAESRVAALLEELQETRQQVAQAVEEQRRALEDKSSSSALMKQQIEARVHKAVEDNSKQAQRTIEELKKKAAAELKKSHDEVKSLTSKVNALTKAQAASKAQADKAAQAHAAALEAAVQAGVQAAVQREKEQAAKASQAAEQSAAEMLRAEHAAELEQLKQQLAAQHAEEQSTKAREFDARLASLESSVATRLQQQQAEHEHALQAALEASRAEAASGKEEQLKVMQQELSARGQRLSEVEAQQAGLVEQLARLTEQLSASTKATEELRKENDKLKDSYAANADAHVEVKAMNPLPKSRAVQPPPLYHAGNTKATDAGKPLDAPPPPARLENKRKPHVMQPSKQVSTGLYADMSDMETEHGPRTGLGGLFNGTTPQADNKRMRVAGPDDSDVISKLDKAGAGAAKPRGSLFGAASLFNSRPSTRDAPSTQHTGPSGNRAQEAGHTLDTQEAPARKVAGLNRKSAGAKTLPRKSAGNARGRMKMMSTQEGN